MRNRSEEVPNQATKFFRDQLITLEDLVSFKNDLLTEIKKLIKELGGQPSKKWLKSHEVRKLLNISHGTLQTMRSNGTLPYTKIGGVIYYNYEDIEQMLSPKRSANPSSGLRDFHSVHNRKV